MKIHLKKLEVLTMKCSSCGNGLGFISNGNSCDADNCKVEQLCKECSKIKLSECEKCGYTFCMSHINNHECDGDDENDSENEVKEVEGMEEGEDFFVSKNKTFKMLHISDFENQDIVNFLEETENEGYVLVASDVSNGSYLFKLKGDVKK